MSKGKTAKAESIKEQEWLVLTVYADMVENDTSMRCSI